MQILLEGGQSLAVLYCELLQLSFVFDLDLCRGSRRQLFPQLCDLVFKITLSSRYLLMLCTDLRHLIIQRRYLFLKLDGLRRALLSDPLRLLHHGPILLTELDPLGLLGFTELFCLSLEHLDLPVLRLQVLQLRPVLLELVLELRVQLDGLGVVLRDLGLRVG